MNNINIIKIEPNDKSFIGFDFDPNNAPLGDLIVITSIPENVYKTHGIKLVDIYKIWVFDYNPYILRDIVPQKILKFGDILSKYAPERCNLKDNPYVVSMSWIYTTTFGMNLTLRHPRLYKFEENIPDGNCICIHTTPKGTDPTRLGHIPENVLRHIFKTYENYKIFQVGGSSDFKINSPNLIDKTGLNFWDTAEIISKCGTFIGLNSGHTHLANCFPKTKKKVLLFNGDYLSKMIPMGASNYGNWIDFNWGYYNNTEEDIGVTMSYLKI